MAYRELIGRLKQRVRESQARAARTVNAELVTLYWSIGREILVQQQANGWGDGVVERISQDLTAEVGGARGFSRRSLFYMRRFAKLWPDREKVPPLVARIGWQLRRTGDRDSVGIILGTNRNEPVAKLALHRVHSPIAVSTWQTDRPTAELPGAKDGDSGELAHLDKIRAQLADRVARHLPADA